MFFNRLNAELNPTCHLLALLGAHHILHLSGLRVKQNVSEFLEAVKYFLQFLTKKFTLMSM